MRTLRIPRFDSWQEAFDYCQQSDRMIVAEVAGEGTRFVVYPSGYAVSIVTRPTVPGRASVGGVAHAARKKENTA